MWCCCLWVCVDIISFFPGLKLDVEYLLGHDSTGRQTSGIGTRAISCYCHCSFSISLLLWSKFQQLWADDHGLRGRTFWIAVVVWYEFPAQMRAVHAGGVPSLCQGFAMHCHWPAQRRHLTVAVMPGIIMSSCPSIPLSFPPPSLHALAWEIKQKESLENILGKWAPPSQFSSLPEMPV